MLCFPKYLKSIQKVGITQSIMKTFQNNNQILTVYAPLFIFENIGPGFQFILHFSIYSTVHANTRPKTFLWCVTENNEHKNYDSYENNLIHSNYSWIYSTELEYIYIISRNK